MTHAAGKEGLLKWMVCKEDCLCEMSTFTYADCMHPTEQLFGGRRKSRNENLRHE